MNSKQEASQEDENYSNDDFIQEDISESSLHFDQVKASQSQSQTQNDEVVVNYNQKKESIKVSGENNEQIAQSLQKIQAIKEMRRDLRIHKTKSHNAPNNLNQSKDNQNAIQSSNNIYLRPLKKPTQRPRIQSSKVQNRTPQILANKPLKLRANQIQMIDEQKPFQPYFKPNSKNDINRQSSTAALFYQNNQGEPKMKSLLISEDQESFVSIQQKKQIQSNDQESTRACIINPLHLPFATRYRYENKSNSKKKQVTHKKGSKGDRNSVKKKSEHDVPMVQENNLIRGQSKQNVQLRNNKTAVNSQSLLSFTSKTQNFVNSRPPSGQRKKPSVVSGSDILGQINGIFSMIKKPQRNRQNIYQKRLERIQKQKQEIAEMRENHIKNVIQMKQETQKIVRIKIQQVQIEIQMMEERSKWLYKEVNKPYKEITSSLITDMEKNIVHARHMMNQQQQLLKQRIDHQRQMRQVEILNTLSQAQENVPFMTFTKIKRAKGIKKEVEVALKERFQLNQPYEFELIGVLRCSPYQKTGDAMNFTYEIEEVNNFQKFPPLNKLFQEGIQILESQKTNNRIFPVSLVKLKVGSLLGKKKGSHVKIQSQQVTSISKEMQRAAKLKQMLHPKLLSVFQNTNLEFYCGHIFTSDPPSKNIQFLNPQQLRPTDSGFYISTTKTSLVHSTIKDLITTQVFEKYFKLTDHEPDKSEVKFLYVLESQIGQNMLQLRRLTIMELFYLVAMNLHITDESFLEQKCLELKLNQNCVLFSHKFKKNGEPTQENSLNTMYAIVSQVMQNQGQNVENEDYYSDDEEFERKRLVYKQFVVQFKVKQNNQLRIGNNREMCVWPSCMQKIPAQSQTGDQPRVLSKQNTEPVIQTTKKRKRPPSSSQNYKYKSNISKPINENNKKILKIPLLNELEFKDSPMLKLLRKFLLQKQNPLEVDQLKNKISKLNERKHERKLAQNVMNSTTQNNFLQIYMRIGRNINLQLNDLVTTKCSYHAGSKCLDLMQYDQNKLQFNQFWKIINSGNYEFWKEDLRCGSYQYAGAGALIHHLFNYSMYQMDPLQFPYDEQPKSNIQILFENKLPVHMIKNFLALSQPSIAPLLEIIDDPLNVGILEDQMVYIHQFTHRLSGKLLLIKNSNYFVAINQFMKQMEVYRVNISQSLLNEQQITQNVFKCLSNQDCVDLGEIQRKKAFLRQLYQKIHDVICNSYVQNQILSPQKTQLLQIMGLPKNHQDVQLKFQRFQSILDQFYVFDQQKHQQHRDQQQNQQFKMYLSNTSNQTQQRSMHQLQQIYQSNQGQASQNNAKVSFPDLHQKIVGQQQQVISPFQKKQKPTNKLQKIYGAGKNEGRVMSSNQVRQIQQWISSNNDFKQLELSKPVLHQQSQVRPLTVTSVGSTIQNIPSKGSIENSLSMQPGLINQKNLNRFTPKRTSNNNTFIIDPVNEAQSCKNSNVPQSNMAIASTKISHSAIRSDLVNIPPPSPQIISNSQMKTTMNFFSQSSQNQLVGDNGGAIIAYSRPSGQGLMKNFAPQQSIASEQSTSSQNNNHLFKRTNRYVNSRVTGGTMIRTAGGSMQDQPQQPQSQNEVLMNLQQQYNQIILHQQQTTGRLNQANAAEQQSDKYLQKVKEIYKTNQKNSVGSNQGSGLGSKKSRAQSMKKAKDNKSKDC